MKIYALSGFLGLPQDWKACRELNVEPIDWQFFPLESLKTWAVHFNHYIAKQKASPRVLMGYSLGGRLALHALIDQPALWQGAIIISAHPGIADPQERIQRMQKDLLWAQRFESESWENLMHDWNAQAVFAQESFTFNRQEVDYQRHQLVNALLSGSLGQQEDLRQKIADLPMPLLWITGRQDKRYCQIAQGMTFSHSHSCWQCIEGAGHRASWSQPQLFDETIKHFLQLIQ